MSIAPLRLKKGQDRRLRFGHVWIYSNEVDIKATPLRGLEPGLPVEILDHSGQWLGWGYANPHSLICARLVSRDREHPLSASLIVHRLKVALALRERLHERPYYRLLFGESDGLPGLVIDRYGDLLVIQITTAGMERMRDDILAAVEKVLKPAAVLFRNDGAVRELEGLERYVEDALGTVPDRVELEEHGARFRVSPREGQKSGWFYDQADNRRTMARYLRGGRVLDICSYVGAWGIGAVAAGAEEAVCVDVSARAVSMVEENAGLNGMEQRVSAVQGDAFEVMKQMRSEKERFDLVVVDPPAFIKRRKDIKEGTLAYRRLNQAALQLLSKDGMLVSSSCSHHMSRDSLLQTLQQAGRHTDRSLQLLQEGQQAPDHPVHPAMPETAYLKSFYLRVLPTL
jgi:23S rRNA (cytosine1962-C5)-methyltransferase